MVVYGVVCDIIVDYGKPHLILKDGDVFENGGAEYSVSVDVMDDDVSTE